MSFIALSKAGKCEDKGGQCVDWRTETCYSGYEQYICPGDNNIRCCLYCSPSCEANEELNSTNDGKCEAQNGECKNDSNYCDGTYQSGLCGGGNERKCCVTKDPPPELELGDVYWNSYSGYSLSTDASSTTYSSFEAAKEQCIILADYCQGITFSSGGYKLKRYIKFSSKSGATSWTKGVKWAPNFVPRVEWEAIDPTGITDFNHPASTGVIGHHTAGHRCFSKSECMDRVRGIQNYHMNSNNWSDVGYNWLIGDDGRIYEGRGPYRQGAHCSHWNVQTLGFSIMGDFSYELPSQPAIDAAAQLIEHMKREGYIDSACYGFYGHRDKGNTVCPGDPLYNLWGDWENWHQPGCSASVNTP